MNRFVLSFAIVIGLSLAAQAAPTYSKMTGKWEGTLVTNVKETGATAGSLTKEATGTPVAYEFTAQGDKVVGTTKLGGNAETWTWMGDKLSMDDTEVTIAAKAIQEKAIPQWVKEQTKFNPTETWYAFQYESCTVNATKKPCEIGKQLPDGIQTSGIWLFKVTDKNLASGVYYKFTKGGKRVLEFSLAKK